ncbi:MAG: S-methyl-5-thioribose-1-phosphate isomerase [Calditerrivibrio sp.]|nr:S-methyl-5-thioribose-1-phosphate isomerase [Calditerrivibrio sp.]
MKEHIFWDGEKLILLDQRKLPFAEEFVTCYCLEDVARAIKDMVVRGAPAIGIAAAYGVVLGVKKGFRRKDIFDILINTRPTAVNLRWALLRCFKEMDEGKDVEIVVKNIHYEDLEINKRIGAYGEVLIKDGDNILTHCNAGALATGGFGTALGVIRSAYYSGKKIHVYVDETRPYLQGARLTSYELLEEGIDCTLICDNMAGYLMQKGLIDSVVVGADRIARNGDVANKIGTYSLAILAYHHQIPFYVAAPLSTFDLSIKDKDEVVVEERDGDEVRSVFGVKVAPDNIKVFNPSFDVTPHPFITCIITERGIIYPPFEENIAKAFNT